jgi:hypothetical protein
MTGPIVTTALASLFVGAIIGWAMCDLCRRKR